MTLEDALQMADEAMWACFGTPLTDIQRMILRESFVGKGYERMEGYASQHIKNEGKKLWDLLSEALGEKVSKTNFKGALEKRLRLSVALKSPMLSTSEKQENVFSDLEIFLQNHQWEEADGETARLMICLSGDKSETQFKFDFINNLSCGSLQEIDCLWEKYSQKKFGFTIQKNIWSRARRDFELFSDKVGWRVDTRWLQESEFKYNLTAPQGHLPSLRWIHIRGWAIGDENMGHNLYQLFEKLLSCSIP